MRRFPIYHIYVVLVLLLLSINTVLAQDEEPVTLRETAPNPDDYTLTEVASGFERPLYLTHAGDGSGRLFVVEQIGQIWILRDGVLSDEPFLDIRDLVSPDALQQGYTERGLLGLAFHPDYEENGFFFINYTDVNGNTVIARYSAADNPELADPASELILLFVEQPYSNHNGGQLAFGPDGYLYIGLGDGGSQGDPFGNGQNPGALLGKILRIDVNAEPYAIPDDNPFVDTADAAPEVWAIGFRNPWRFSFDRATGDLYIADVGQNQWEEINFQPAESTGGENYGWNVYESNYPYSGAPAPANMVLPVTEYSHNQGCSVTGGYVYRGEALTDLQGVYLFADYCSGRTWALYRDTAEVWQTIVFRDTARQISSFGEDEQGELYMVDYSGTIYSLQAVP